MAGKSDNEFIVVIILMISAFFLKALKERWHLVIVSPCCRTEADSEENVSAVACDNEDDQTRSPSLLPTVTEVLSDEQLEELRDTIML